MNVISTPWVQTSRIRSFFVRGVTSFVLFYTPTYLSPLTARNILDNPGHPLYPQTKRRYDEKDKTTLWWSVHGVKSQIPTAVVRRWGEARLKQAFRLALKDRGFDAKGRRILGRGGVNVVALQGTVRLQVMKPIVTLSGVDVREQARLAIDKVVQLCSDHSRETRRETRNDRGGMNSRPR